MIRTETTDDHEVVHQINQRAFNAEGEARIVANLRNNCDGIISLVAQLDDRVVGHILFSPVRIEDGDKILHGMGLAPMAVLPEYQHQGIGKQLIEEGLSRIKQTDCPFVIVLGHPEYYPKFGFQRAADYGLKPQWDGIPDEVFMLLVLNKDALTNVSGVVYYRDEFNDAM